MLKQCPRCFYHKKESRLNGDEYCTHCGQRWTSKGELIPSFDRRSKQDNMPKENIKKSFSVSRWVKENFEVENSSLVLMLQELIDKGITKPPKRDLLAVIKDCRYNLKNKS